MTHSSESGQIRGVELQEFRGNRPFCTGGTCVHEPSDRRAVPQPSRALERERFHVGDIRLAAPFTKPCIDLSLAAAFNSGKVH